MAQRTRAQYKALYGTSGTLFPDNTTGEISEADIRAFGEDGADSVLFKSDDLLDEDDMASDSATKVPSQQSVKAYVDAAVGGGGAVSSVNGETGVVVLDADDVPFTPAGNIVATTVQAAINELDTEKAPLSTYYVASGTNDYAVTIPWITALAAGQSFDIQFTNANTAPVKLTNYVYPTLNINTLGAVPLKIHGAVDLSIGDIVANQIYRASYDGTNIQLIGKRLEEKVFNVEYYGAWHDYASVDDAAVSSGTTALTSVNANFTSGVTGKTMRVFGAGAAGADLITTVTYVSESQVTLGVAASTTVSGAVIEWGHDDTASIQAAIDACNAYGGGTVYFPAGVYLIAGALVTSVDSVNPNAQIYIPLNVVGVNRLTIKLKGEGGTTFNNGPLNNSNITYNPRSGVILKSIIPGSGTTPSVFCSSFANNGFTDVNRNALVLEDIAIQVKSRTGAAHTAPTMTAWNLFYMGVTFLNNVSAFTESPVWVSVAPTTGTYGIRLPRTSSNESYGGVHGFAFAQGFDIGIAIQEHDVWNRFTAVGCHKGFQIGQSGADGPHSIIGQQLHAFACNYSVEFTGGPNIHISQVSIERYPGSFPTSRWYDNLADFLATSLSGASGTVKYNIVNSGGAVGSATFSGTFGGQINFIDLQADSYYIYLAGLTVNGNQPFHQLKYTGAAVATSVSFPTRNMVHNQSGTANVVTLDNYVNIASSASDKRLLIDSTLTNGSAQKGLRRVSMHSGTAVATVMELSTDFHRTLVPEIVDAAITPAQITANQDNYAPTGIGTADTLRLSTDASRNITGINAGTSMINGRELTIINVGAQNIVLSNNVTSTAANRFLLNADVTILPEQQIILKYDGTSARWRKVY